METRKPEQMLSQSSEDYEETTVKAVLMRFEAGMEVTIPVLYEQNPEPNFLKYF